jgi:hypothetical protein
MIAAVAKAAILKVGGIQDEPSKKYLGSLFLVAALATPVTIMAVPASQDDREHKRVYDRDHNGYPHWDDNENREEGAVRILELPPQPSR